jgi:hypothetical protein
LVISLFDIVFGLGKKPLTHMQQEFLQSAEQLGLRYFCS